MVYDFENPAVPSPAHSEVCILGAGAAGILLATRLANAGFRVVLLEGGGLEQEPRSQKIYQSEIAGLHHRGIHDGRYRTYGGTTTQWGGQILELDDWDFEPRSHVPGSGWPISKTELIPHYQSALEFEGLRHVEQDDRSVWARLSLDPVEVGPEFAMLFSRWCPERNFARLQETALSTTHRLAVYTHANAIAFELNAAKTAISALSIRSFGGRQARVTAGQFILCMGGIESTRFLLQPSADQILPWQTNGLLGRFYQDHIGVNGISITGIKQKPIYNYFGYTMLDGFRYHNKIHLKEELQSKLQTLNIAGTIGPVHRENPGRDKALALLRRAVRDRYVPSPSEIVASAAHMPGIATHMLSQRYRGPGPEWKKLSLVLHCEQSPTSASTITLSEQRDEMGLLRTRLNWVVSDHEIYSLRTFARLASQSFERYGFAKVHLPKGFHEDDGVVRSLCGDSYHHMGGTRMSIEANDGIVDPNLKLHGIDNGYVCSASVFPCSGFSNPTHTVLALAVRLAERLTQQLALPSARTFTMLSTGLPTAGGMRSVELPGSTKRVPQLGFGCAYLLGPGLDRATSHRLLDTAYAEGIRHFDVARLYGQGHTEALVGEFLRKHADATVTTKFGIKPPSHVERALLIAQRRIPRLPRGVAAYKRNDKERFNAAEASKSLQRSLRLLGRDHIELLLLHEATSSDVGDDDLLAFLEAQRSAGTIGDYGIGGEFAAIPELYRSRCGFTRVLQFECSVFGPTLHIPNVRRIHYRTFSKAAQVLGRFLRSDPELLRAWSEIVDAELEEPLVLSRLLLKASLEAYPDVLQLFSTRQGAHITDNVAVAANDGLVAPALRLLELARTVSPKMEQLLYPQSAPAHS